MDDGAEAHEQPKRDAGGSGGYGGGAAQAATQPASSSITPALCRAYRAGRTAAAGAGAGADTAVSGAQMQMVQLLPPSAAEDASSSWTTVSYGGHSTGRAQRLFKRPASRPASALASPVSSAQVGPT